jgi:hypothetical protein
MPIDRTAYNLLVDDSGGNLDGTLWTKNQVKTVLLDAIDANVDIRGTWTPTLVSSGGGTPTYLAQTGVSFKTGAFAFLEGTLTISAFNTLAAGTLTIGGLPFTCGGAHGTVHIPYWGTLAANASSITGYVSSGTATIILLWVTGAGQTVGSTQLTKADITASMTFVFSAMYCV